jgi:5,10-methylenetetrahydromethanopterin reductase
MELGATFCSRLNTPDHIAVAERLGYDFAWVADSPALFCDPWMTLARAADRTSRLRLGVSVITPRMRHLVANACALATLDGLAPDRVEVVVGSGFTSQAMIGKKPARWAEVEQYVVGLRVLLSGEELEWDGALTALEYGALTGVQLPAKVPIMVAAHGPKGLAVAERIADGVVTNPMHGSENVVWPSERVFVQVNGTVLEEDETLDSERVLQAAGPAAALHLHLGGEGAAAGMPELAGYEERLEAVDPRRRHLELHRGHFMEVTEMERPFVTADLIRRASDTGTRSEVREFVRSLAAQGVTAVILPPCGPDVERELTLFAECVRGA